MKTVEIKDEAKEYFTKWTQLRSQNLKTLCRKLGEHDCIVLRDDAFMGKRVIVKIESDASRSELSAQRKIELIKHVLEV